MSCSLSAMDGGTAVFLLTRGYYRDRLLKTQRNSLKYECALSPENKGTLASCGPPSNFALLINQNMWAGGKADKKGGELWAHEIPEPQARSVLTFVSCPFLRSGFCFLRE